MILKINLTRPLVFIDIEGTGLDTENDRIIELSVCKLHPDGTREVKTKRYNPGVPIPAKSTEIHGIKDEDVADKPLFKQEAKGIHDFIKDCDIAGFNSNRYDIPMLYNELLRAGVEYDWRSAKKVDVGNIFKIKEPRTLGAALKFYCDKELENAHSAESDILATVDVFEKQLERYEDLPKDLADLELFSNYDSPMVDLAGKFKMVNGVIHFNFGKYISEPAKNHPDFLEWMVYRASFPADTTRVAADILQNHFENE